MSNQRDQLICRAIIEAWRRGAKIEAGDTLTVVVDGAQQKVTVEKRHWQTADRFHGFFDAGLDLSLVTFDVAQAGEAPRMYLGQNLLR